MYLRKAKGPLLVVLSLAKKNILAKDAESELMQT